jgi:hypothetical protein
LIYLVKYKAGKKDAGSQPARAHDAPNLPQAASLVKSDFVDGTSEH